MGFARAERAAEGHYHAIRQSGSERSAEAVGIGEAVGLKDELVHIKAGARNHAASAAGETCRQSHAIDRARK